MKVVIFCGGRGTRLREAGENTPKPMALIGDRPILWHLMRYYAHFGHTDFVLCLGYGAAEIRNYFLAQRGALPTTIPYRRGESESAGAGAAEREGEGACVTVDNREWHIAFADTGEDASIGQRLFAARKYVEQETDFLANYADGLSDLPLPVFIDRFRAAGKVANFVAVRPSLTQHFVSAGADGVVRTIQPATETNLRVNGGYFLFRREIFDYMREGEELVQQPFQRLIAAGELFACPHDGWFGCMDTFKEKQQLNDDYAGGRAQWELWRDPATR